MPFLNSDDNTFTNIYSLSVKSSEWEAKYFSQVWPLWKKNIKGKFLKNDASTQKPVINTIDDYYNATTGVITRQLRVWLELSNDDESANNTWERWIGIW
ncbi:hypothetical protein, partial [Salmonella sp. s51933]|uniref:hypothetical protein n=1 Tax=Salmonella sp. s51933 TaxID=3160127 RepID=UPI003754A5E8